MFFANVTAYPSAIARACAALDESPSFKDLPDGYLRVLIRIIKKINLASLRSPIFASRKRIAEEAGKSIETVGRVIKWLDDREFIERNQIARPGLKGSSSPLIPTAKLLNALTLTSKPAVDPIQIDHPTPEGGEAIPPCPSDRSPVRPAVSVSTPRKQSKETQSHTRSCYTKRRDVFIPTELVWMVDKGGVSPTGILKLMKIAKAHNHRLSHIVQVTRQYLEHLTGKELFSYIRKVATTERDFRFAADQEVLTQQQERHKALVLQKMRDLAGRTYRTRDDRTVVTVLENGGLRVIRDRQERGFRPMDMQFLEAIEDGVLISSGTDESPASGNARRSIEHEPSECSTSSAHEYSSGLPAKPSPNEQRPAPQDQAQLHAKWDELKGRVFKSTDDTILVTVEEKGRLRVHRMGSAPGYIQMNTEFLRGIETGYLVQTHL